MNRLCISGRLAALLLFLPALLLSCRKENPGLQSYTGTLQTPETCSDCAYLQQSYQDSVDRPTFPGREIRNPYLIPVMEKAWRNVYHRPPNHTLQVTHLYVRFSPADYFQLSRLENEEIELYGYPLHRQLLSEGDYYLQEGKGLEDIPDYFAVVENGYRFPPGIRVQVLAQMHIPDNNPLLENEALRLTDNLQDQPEIFTGYYPGKTLSSDGRETGPNELNDGDPQEPDQTCGHYPAGRITLQEELLTNRNFQGVANVKVIVRRLFKQEKISTATKGYFRCSKYFRNKYTVVVKFKNSLARVARMRPWALHEQFFPIKINFGKWDRLSYSHEFRITHPGETGRITTSHWCAAVIHNTIQEYRTFCNTSGIALPPQDLNIMISSKKGSGTGNTYMLNKILLTNPAPAGTEVVLTSVVLFWTPVGAALALTASEAYKARAPDVKYGYGADPSYLTSDRYGELVMHELSHASHYSVVGNDWWLKFGLAESKNAGEGFYGGCCSDYASRIALGEGWAFFIGHMAADWKWGPESTPFPEAGNLATGTNLIYFSNGNGISSHIRFLESFDPFRHADLNYWIPKGMFYDLYDPVVELYPGSNIRDEVSGISIRELFGAMTSDVNGMDAYRIKLLRTNQDQGVKIIDLFTQYGY